MAKDKTSSELPEYHQKIEEFTLNTLKDNHVSVIEAKAILLEIVANLELQRTLEVIKHIQGKKYDQIKRKYAEAGKAAGFSADHMAEGQEILNYCLEN